MPDPKPRREVDEDYMDYIRDKECLIRGRPNPDLAHLTTRGAGGSDYTCVPLCREHHNEQEDSTLREFEDKYNINLWKEAHRLLRRYFSNTTNPAR